MRSALLLSVGLVPTFSALVATSALAQNDRATVLQIALARVLRGDSAACSVAPCASVGLVVRVDSVSVPTSSTPPLVQLGPHAAVDSLGSIKRVLVLRELSVSDGSAIVALDQLFSVGTRYSPMTPARTPGSLPPPAGGWRFHLRRTDGAWSIHMVEEWIT